MTKFWHLLKHELTILHRHYHILRHSAYITLFASIMLSMMLSRGNEDNYTKMVLILFGSVLAAVTIPTHLIKTDIMDGSLENIMTKMRASEIIFAKYFSIFISVTTGTLLAFPIAVLFYSLELSQIATILTIILPIILLINIQICAILLLGNIIHAYFRQNTNMILAIIIPLIIPSLIIATMGIATLKTSFILILLGMNMALVPIILVLGTYLCTHIYEF